MKKVKVWDLAVRLTHAGFGVLVLGAFLTSDSDEWTPVHTRLGLVLLGLVLFRVVWGFVGPRHARFADFVKRPAEVWAAAKALARGRPGDHLGHNPVGGVMVVVLLATLAVCTATGIVIALGPEWSGPLSALLTQRGAHAVKEVHEAASWLLVVFVGLHVAGVLVSSLLERRNLVAGMVTGYKVARTAPVAASAPASAPGLVARVAGFAAALLLGAGAVALLWGLMPAPEAEAATASASASALLDGYAAQARVEDPRFRGFDAARGKALYFTEVDGRAGRSSCATCHTRDARTTGRSPVGKVIEPLAPSINPERFTDAAKADKWFDRNCKQVLGRPCTALERGDFVTYLTSLTK